MTKRTEVEVIINNKRYTLGGYESEEHMQKVASYINAKYAVLKEQKFYQALDYEMRNVLLQINLADDYFKLQEEMKQAIADSDCKSDEIFDLKHELVQLRTTLDAVKSEMESIQREKLEQEKAMIRLETELRTLKNRQQKGKR